MKEVFSEQLFQFVNTVDILEEGSFKEVISLMKRYLAKSLEIEYIKIMHLSESMSDSGTSLNKLFSTENIPIDKDIKDKGQMPFAFIKEKKMWITPRSSKELLLKTQDYVDLWSGVRDIPQYRSFDKNSKKKTSIIIPLFHDFRHKECIGVLNFESKSYLEPTPIAKEVLEQLASVIATGLRLYSIRKQFEKSTQKSLERLNKAVEEPCFKLTKPKLFFGYPKKSEDDVLAMIKEIIDEAYSKDVILNDWGEKRLPEQITDVVFDEIKNSPYGIYYFSEPVDNSDNYKYEDNRNVIFEAGLHHGQDSDANWILIREKESDNISFDFNNFRRIDVPRDSKGTLKKEAFKVLLKETLDAMLE